MIPSTQNVGNLVIRGMGSANGGEFSQVRIMGEGTVEGSLSCHTTRVMGKVAVKGDMVSDIVKITGELEVKGNCSAEAFRVRGAFQIGGLLNSGQITVNLLGPSKVRELGGGKIRIKCPRIGNFTPKHFTADVIEGDDVRLEYTNAQVVRGGYVAIGRGCTIDLVEYAGDFRQSSQSTVKMHRHVGDSHEYGGHENG